MTIQRSLLASAAAALAIAASISSAQAATVVISNIKAQWKNAAWEHGVGTNVDYDHNNGSYRDPSVSWGNGTSSGGWEQSGYDFVAPASSFSTGNFDALGGFDSGDFLVGTFTHRNNPITGNALKTIDLLLTADLSINGAAAQTYSFLYNFTHDETDNNDRPCPYGGYSVNKNGCADLVTFNFNSISDHFNIDGTDYTLNLAGFLDNGDPITSFLSKEKRSNSADIVGRITAWKDVVPGGVPEPSTWAMMILGFGFIGGIMRRKQNQSVRYGFS